MFPDLDAANQRLVETQSRVRRALGTVAVSRKRLEMQIRRLEQEVWGRAAGAARGWRPAATA